LKIHSKRGDLPGKEMGQGLNVCPWAFQFIAKPIGKHASPAG